MKGSVQKILAEMREAGLRELAARIDIAMHNDLYELETQLKKSMMLNEAWASAKPGVGVGVVTIEDRPAAGDGAKIRAALGECLHQMRRNMCPYDECDRPKIQAAIEKADAALKAPARPCDKYGDAVAAMAELKRRHNECAEEGHPCLEDCPDCGQVKCAIAWLMSPEKGGAQ